MVGPARPVDTTADDGKAPATARLATDGAVSYWFSGAALPRQLVDPALAPYRPTPRFGGETSIAGSETMHSLVTKWYGQFRKRQPNVRIDIQGGGSAAGATALGDGRVHLAMLTREMTRAERLAFRKKRRGVPRSVAVGIDAVAVYVHQDNPIGKLTLQQLDAIFSSTRKSGLGAITHWAHLGLAGKWSSESIRLYGREARSATGQLYREVALSGGDFLPTLEEQSRDAAVVRAVAKDPFGIGFASLSGATSELTALRVSRRFGSPFHAPDPLNVVSRRYPLARSLLVYFDRRKPGFRDSLAREFLVFALSREGQTIAAQEGFLPLNAALVRRQLRRLR